MKHIDPKSTFWFLLVVLIWPVHALAQHPSTPLANYIALRDAGVRHVADELLLRTRKTSVSSAHVWAKHAGCAVQRRMGKRPLFVLRCRSPLAQAIASLQQRKEVVGVEVSQHLDLHTDLPDDWSTEQWHHQNYGQQIGNRRGQVGADIDTPEAWAIQTGRTQPVVAILDTGVRLDHEDLQGQIWQNTDELCHNGIDDDDNGYIDDCFGWDVGNNDNLPDPLTISEKDIDGDNCPRHHGTFIAGLIGARGNNARGTVGVCWSARLMVLKKTRDETCVSTSTEAVEAAAYALDNGADILSMSFGARFHSAQFEAILSEASEMGLLLVTSAGNDGHDGDQFISFPQDLDLDHQIVVANSTNSDALAGSSNWGATTVHLAAPGQTLRSTGIRSTRHYTTGTGTSYSSPLVAATGALIWSAFPRLSVDDVQESILLGVDTLDNLDCASSEKCVSTAGRLNVLGALVKAAEFAGETELIIAQEEHSIREVTPSDVIEIQLAVHNIGGITAEDTIALADPDQPTELQNDTVYFGTVLAGMVSHSRFGLLARIPQTCVGNFDVQLRGQFLARGGSWPFQITQPVNCGPDRDRDGAADRIDCAPDDPLRFPGADEICDGIDNDCDVAVDEDPVGDSNIRHLDVDGDGYGDFSDNLASCAALDGYADRSGDCNPFDASISPDAQEICDRIDNNCDGLVDEDPVDANTYFLDRDGDGHGDDERVVSSCVRPPGYVLLGDDCDDDDQTAYPNAPQWDADCQRRTSSSKGCHIAVGNGADQGRGLSMFFLALLVFVRIDRLWPRPMNRKRKSAGRTQNCRL